MHCLDVRRMEAMRLVRLCPRSRQNTYSSRQDYLPCQQPSRFNAKADQPKSGSPCFATSLNPVLEKNRNNYGSETVDFGGPVDQDSASDEVFTGADDKVIGGGADDGLFGGIGKDKLWGDDATEAELGGAYHGSDYLDGGDDDDQLIGGGKDDFLYGRAGNDLVWGDAENVADLAGQYHGNDYLDGGDGND